MIPGQDANGALEAGEGRYSRLKRRVRLLAEWRAAHYVVAVALVALFSFLRVEFLGSLQARIPYLTYYPAVMMAAVIGGGWVGVVATALSCVCLLFFWPLFTPVPFIRDPADWLGMGVFVMNCVMMSAVAEVARRARQKALEAQVQAEMANRSKSVFLASMSHELRTPLNAVLGFSSLLLDEAGMPETSRKQLQIIHDSGAHLLGLINNVLDMAKIEAGKVDSASSTVEVRAAVETLLDMVRARADDRGVALAVETSPEVPRFVRIDADLLGRVVGNLVGNAVKFTANGTVTLRLDWEARGDGSSSDLVVEVEDTGEGIPAEQLERIFEPFVQLGQVSPQQGTGLGLSIARQSADALRGSLDVRSTLGQGSVFRLRVPVGVVAEPGPTEGTSPRRVLRLEAGQPAWHLLVVEDHAENWMLLQHLLEKVGFEVRVALDGAQGVAAFQEWRPHLVWMDMRMPVMDGFEASRRIREMEGGRDVKIVALTASVFHDQRDEILAAGLDDFLGKPFAPDAIYACLERHLGARFVRAEAAAPRRGRSEGPIDRDALAGLDHGVREDLVAALVALDAARIAEVVDRVCDENADLGTALRHHAGRLEYTAMLQAVKTC